MEKLEKSREIWFDMDGTIADLYGVKNWLYELRHDNEHPYKAARPLVNMQALARVLNRLQKQGYKIGVISWLSRGGSAEYGERVKAAKLGWLRQHLASVHFDKIDIVPHGEPKEHGRAGILFDDEEKNRKNWHGDAYDEKNIIKILRTL